MQPYQRLDKEIPVVQHEGIFRKQISLWQATALIVSGTIGAGVLGIPYAIAKIGVPLGLLYILSIGLLMMCMNLLLGEVALHSGEPLQLVGLAKKYLGRIGGGVMTVLSFTLLFGVLTVYIIGVGQSGATVFGGSATVWSLGFFVIAAGLVSVGLRTIKTVELFLMLGLLTIVIILTFFGAGHIQLDHWQYTDAAQLFFPYGILLFSFHATTAVPETYSVIQNREKTFHQAIILASLIVMAVYVIFTLVVVGVTGRDTTEIATIGLGAALGRPLAILGNLFAIFAMGTSFLMAGVALRDSLRWDYHCPNGLATIFVCGVPLTVFLFGLRSFIGAIDLIGGLFMSGELLLILLMYARARRHIHHEGSTVWSVPLLFLLSLLLLAFTVGAIYSFKKVF